MPTAAKLASIKHLAPPALSIQDALKHLHMCAAIWAACYPEPKNEEDRAGDRFRTIWAQHGPELHLLDVGDDRMYSMSLEGLLSKYVLGLCRKVPSGAFGKIAPGGLPFTWEHVELDLTSVGVTAADWDALQYAMHYWVRSSGGFHGHECIFVDKAIRGLRTGAVYPRGTFRKLTQEDEDWTNDYLACQPFYATLCD